MHSVVSNSETSRGCLKIEFDEDEQTLRFKHSPSLSVSASLWSRFGKRRDILSDALGLTCETLSEESQVQAQATLIDQGMSHLHQHVSRR